MEEISVVNITLALDRLTEQLRRLTEEVIKLIEKGDR